MSAVANVQNIKKQELVKKEVQEEKRDKGLAEGAFLPDGVVYSRQQNIRPFSTPPLEAYNSIIGEEKTDRLQRAAQRLQGLKLLELNATAQGGGVAEMLYSSVPFMDRLGIETEWKVIQGNDGFFETTKRLHNLLPGHEAELRL